MVSMTESAGTFKVNAMLTDIVKQELQYFYMNLIIDRFWPW